MHDHKRVYAEVTCSHPGSGIKELLHVLMRCRAEREDKRNSMLNKEQLAQEKEKSLVETSSSRGEKQRWKRWKVKQVICETCLPHLSSVQPLGAIACWIHAQSILDRQSRPSFKNQHAKHGYQLSFSCCPSMSYRINNAEPFLTLCSPAARLQPSTSTPCLTTCAQEYCQGQVVNSGAV